MGELSFPPLSKVYIDTAPVIYSVEKIPDYWPLLRPLWQAAKAKEIEILTSELTLLEALVQPIRQNDQRLISAYDTLLTKTEISLFPITREILRLSADLRATHNFKTPDAIHCATASSSGCGYLVANDATFRRMSQMEVIILSDLL